MAKRFFRTTTGDRPELAAIGSTSQLDVMGYAFPKIFPLRPVTEKSGVTTVAPAGLTNAKGTEGRANGTKLNATDIANVDVNWAVARFEGRARQYENDASAYSSQEAADQAGAEVAQRLAWNKVEDKAFATIFTNTRKSAAAELADHHVVRDLQKKAKAVRKYGKATLVMTTNTWLDFVDIPEIRVRLASLAGAGNDISYILSDVAKVRASVSTFLSVNDIVLFDSDIVGTACDGYIAVIGLRPEAAGNVTTVAKTKAVYGFTNVYIPEDAPADKPFDMRSWYDDDNKANVFDSEAFLGLSEAHSGAVEMTKFAAEYTEYVSIINQQAGE